MNYIRNFINERYDVEWNNAPERKGDVKHTLADISETQRDLGFEPLVSIEKGLSRCFCKNNLKKT
jgi:nucleoside-diphosphate-sugar epimerase